MKLVWPDSFVGEDSVTQNIATLRKALDDAADQPRYIATVPRRGYRFVAQVQHVSDESGKPLLWVRGIDSVDARSLPGTDGAWAPFWSPDSESLGFFAQGALKRIGLSGAPLQTVTADPSVTHTPGGAPGIVRD